MNGITPNGIDPETQKAIEPLSKGIFDAINGLMRDEDGDVIVSGEVVVASLVDVLASMVAASPHTGTIRGRREYCDEICRVFGEQVKAYQALRVQLPNGGATSSIILPGAH